MVKFFDLPKKERSELIQSSAYELGFSTKVIEKDIWVCWVLEKLFQMPNRLPMAFKGGTSLSKVFNLIKRFSEDIDITLDYRGFGPEFDLFSAGISNSKIRKISEELKSFVCEHVNYVVGPYFRNLLNVTFLDDAFNVEISDNGEELRVYYPSVLEYTDSEYINNSVLLEFGGRNIIEPNQKHVVRPYLSEVFSKVEFPSANVTVLSPARTFWEKVTLIHVECHRKEFKENANRLSRHWYDLSLLSKHDICEQALSSFELLSDVIKFKKLFYNSSYANYDACLQNAFQLVPNDQFLNKLKSDFENMINIGMFYGEQPKFETVIKEIKTLESKLNSLALIGSI